MKKIFLSISSLVLLVATSLTLAACNLGGSINTTVIGENLPNNIKAKYNINAAMDALQMYETGLKNYEAIDYVGAQQYGKINAPAGSKMDLSCKRVKENNTIFMDSITIDTAGIKSVKLIEEVVVEDGIYRIRTAKGVKVENNIAVAKGWNETKTYNTVSEALNYNPNDPTRLNMYTVNEDSVISATEPVYDKKTRQYSFTITLDPIKGSKDYTAVMLYNLEQQGFSKGQVAFKELELDIIMWDNGLIRSVTNREAYDVKLGIISGVTSNIATNYYTYNRNELKIKELIKF